MNNSNYINQSTSHSQDIYQRFSAVTMRELEDCLIHAASREEKAFYRALLNFKLQAAQEKVVGEELL